MRLSWCAWRRAITRPRPRARRWGAGGGGRGQPESQDDAASMKMTPEEHARMQAGGAQGATDTSGQALRQPVHLTEAQERAPGVVYTTARRETLTKETRPAGP